MYSPTNEETERFSAEGYGAIPVSRTVLADIRTPIEVLRTLMGVDSHCYILESVENRQRWGRYTFLGFDPILDIVCSDGRTEIRENGDTKVHEGDPTEVIRDCLLYTSPSPRDA